MFVFNTICIVWRLLNIPNRNEEVQSSSKYYPEVLSTPFTMNRKVEHKSKSGLVQNNLRFPSDTKIMSEKSFKLFGGNEFDEDNINIYQHESNFEDEKLAK